MNTMELFSGTKSFSKVAALRGHSTFTVDNDIAHVPDLPGSVLDPAVQLVIWDRLKDTDIVWMSPVCISFSLASGSKHWAKDKRPNTATAIEGRALLDMCKHIADYCIGNRKLFFIENPMARMRWFMEDYKLTHVWYCQYGDSRAKPTDIWNNLDNWTGKKCRNGNKECHHESAPRGSRTGTQGIKGSKARSVVPPMLIEEIFDVIESNNNLLS